MFVSVAFYAAARELGMLEAEAEVKAQLAARPSRDTLPAVRTIHRLKHIDDLVLHLDFAGTNAAKSRSRAAHAALLSGEDVWVACDDDVEASYDTLLALVDAVRGRAAVCSAPCYLRRPSGEELLNVAGVGALPIPRQVGELAYELRSVEASGFGLVAISQLALRMMVTAHPDLRFVDDDGATRAALFLEVLEDGRWYGEDFAFFRRLPSSVEAFALATGRTSHGGLVVDLGELDTLPTCTLAPPATPVFNVPGLEPLPVAKLEASPAAAEGVADVVDEPKAPELSPEHAELLRGHLEAEAAAAAPPESSGA